MPFLVSFIGYLNPVKIVYNFAVKGPYVHIYIYTYIPAGQMVSKLPHTRHCHAICPMLENT